jgi:phage/plasmid-associated DNA primase
VDKDLMSNLSQTDLHKIINGERVEINIKHGGRVTLQWVAPFMLVANVVPNWQDDQGQMTRRIVYFDFNKKPATSNSKLADELKEARVQVQMLLRCSKIYRKLAVLYQNDGIMPNILAKYYPRRTEVGSKVQRNNDPLMHFISEMLVYSPGRTVSLRSLATHKARFCKEYEYDTKTVQFRKEFQNIVASKGMKVYSITEIAAYARTNPGQTLPKTAFIDNCSISMNAVLMEDSD